MTKEQVSKRIKARARVLARNISATEIRAYAPGWVWEIAAMYDGRASGSFTEGKATMPVIRAIALDIAAGGNSRAFGDADYDSNAFGSIPRLLDWVRDVYIAREYCDMCTGTLTEILRTAHRDWVEELYRDTVANLIVMGE
jgi:hypothetical protein